MWSVERYLPPIALDNCHNLTSLLSLCQAFGFLRCSVSRVWLSQLPFCGPNTIDHSVRGIVPLMAQSCAPTPVTEIVSYVLSSFIIILTLRYILGPCSLVVIAMLTVPSAADQQKAFFTCASHLTVVCLFLEGLLTMHVSLTADNPAEIQKNFYDCSIPQ